MTMKQILKCTTLLIAVLFGTVCIAAGETLKTTVIKPTMVDPYNNAVEEKAAKARKEPGACCNTRGAPECGGSCDICCEKDASPSCVAGSCDPNNTFACTCQVLTSCSCN